MKFLKLLTKPVSIPLWQFVLTTYIVFAFIWRSEITQAFFRGLTGG